MANGVEVSKVLGSGISLSSSTPTSSIVAANSGTGLVLVKRVSTVLAPALTPTSSGTLLEVI